MRRIKKIDLNHPDTTTDRREFIFRKPFMRRMYVEWYQCIQQSLPENPKVIIELGAGPGFIKQEIPEVITSDILFLPFLDAVMNGQSLPFGRHTIDGIVMVDVFHHISDARSFFHEVDRALRVEGRLIMIEPWITPWSKWVLSGFHHEPVDVEARDWVFSSSGPLTGANQALPWNVFHRDRNIFADEFPNLKIESIKPFMPVTYLLGGGFSTRASIPGFLYRIVRWFERRFLDPKRSAMFALIVVEKIK